MSFELEAVHIFYVSLVVSAVLFVEAGYLLLAPDNSARKHINRRMTASGKKKISQKDILVQLRKERGLDADGNFVLPMKWLNQLVVQAGITVGMPRVMMYWGGFFLVSIPGDPFHVRLARAWRSWPRRSPACCCRGSIWCGCERRR